MDSLDAERGRSYRATCGADLGDARCRVDLAPLRIAATVRALPGPGILALDLAHPVPDGTLAGGRLAWTRGANAGLAGAVRAHADGSVELWEAPPRAVVPGDALMLDPGCDKRLATCARTFANAVNFEGFPHLPGNDVVLRQAPGSGPGLDGGSLFRTAPGP